MAALEIVEKEVIARIGVLRSSDRRLWSLTLEVAVCGDCHADAAEKKISNAVERKVLVAIAIVECKLLEEAVGAICSTNSYQQASVGNFSQKIL